MSGFIIMWLEGLVVSTIAGSVLGLVSRTLRR